MPRAIGKASDIDACGLTLSELQELWLGAHPTTGSHFRSREDLVAAWEAGRAVVMRLWGSHGRRPMGWWEFDAGDLKHPGYDRERSVLWRAGVLSAVECAELEDALLGPNVGGDEPFAEWHGRDSVADQAGKPGGDRGGAE